MYISIKTISDITKIFIFISILDEMTQNSFSEPICTSTQNFRTSICYWGNMDDYFSVFSHSFINFQKITKSTCFRIHFGKMFLKWHLFHKTIFEHLLYVQQLLRMPFKPRTGWCITCLAFNMPKSNMCISQIDHFYQFFRDFVQKWGCKEKITSSSICPFKQSIFVEHIC